MNDHKRIVKTLYENGIVGLLSFLLTCILQIFSVQMAFGQSQPPQIQWEKIFETADAFSVQQTKDGGYVVAGEKFSSEETPGGVYVIKLDPQGNLKWEKTYSGKGFHTPYSIQQTSDDGYIVAGGDNYFALKLDDEGNKVWSKVFKKKVSTAYSVQQTKDGGYILAGEVGGAIYVVKLAPEGK